jgi:pyruvate carboxylase
VSLFKGELGRPPEGFPEALSDKILQGKQPMTERPGKGLGRR